PLEHLFAFEAVEGSTTENPFANMNSKKQKNKGRPKINLSPRVPQIELVYGKLSGELSTSVGSDKIAWTPEFLLEVEELHKVHEMITRVYALRTGKPFWVWVDFLKLKYFMMMNHQDKIDLNQSILYIHTTCQWLNNLLEMNMCYGKFYPRFLWYMEFMEIIIKRKRLIVIYSIMDTSQYLLMKERAPVGAHLRVNRVITQQVRRAFGFSTFLYQIQIIFTRFPIK
ncbi:hypothetical protein ACJX0J_007613, partial [Zea mays]